MPVNREFRIDLAEDFSFKSHCHPEFGHEVDICAFEVSNKVGIAMQKGEAILPFDFGMIDSDPDYEIGEQVFIAGFPALKTPVPNRFPIVKSAFLASEPHVFDRKPCFLLDGKTKSGWSGSPILRYTKNRVGFSTSESMRIAPLGWTLVGLYSGRDESDQELLRAELGYAWPVHLLLKDILQQAQQA